MRVSNPVVAHSQLTGVTTDQHHARDHWATHLAGGADAGVGAHAFAKTAADVTVNNSTTPVDITGMDVFMAVAGTWVLRFVYFVSGVSITTDLKLAFTLTGGIGAVRWTGRTATSFGTADSVGVAVQGATSSFGTGVTFNILTSDVSIVVIDMLLTATGALACQGRFAQGVADVSDTKVLASSYAIAHRAA